MAAGRSEFNGSERFMAAVAYASRQAQAELLAASTDALLPHREAQAELLAASTDTLTRLGSASGGGRVQRV